MSTKPSTLAELFDYFSDEDLAEVIGSSFATARQLRYRNSLPINYWPDILRAAPDFGLRGLTTDDLLAICPKRKKPKPLSRKRAA